MDVITKIQHKYYDKAIHELPLSAEKLDAGALVGVDLQTGLVYPFDTSPSGLGIGLCISGAPDKHYPVLVFAYGGVIRTPDNESMIFVRERVTPDDGIIR